ncbi:MAG: hypothetical protein ACJAVF_002304 [Paraglaciecola sp.]|jgi:hypothetical protein
MNNLSFTKAEFNRIFASGTQNKQIVSYFSRS